MSTPTDILNAWRRVSAVFGGRSSGWLKLLAIAEAGEAGVTAQAIIGDSGGQCESWPFLESLERRGLIEVERGAVPHSRGGRRSNLLRITPDGARFLGVAAFGHSPGAEIDLVNTQGEARL